MKDKIEYFCVTCRKKLVTIEGYNKCFNKNHSIRVSGFITVGNSITKDATINKKLGVAVTNAKAGEKVIVKLE